MGLQYEINGLTTGKPYHVRVSASNSRGECNEDVLSSDECGGYILTSPSTDIPRQPPAKIPSISASIIGIDSVLVNWQLPTSVSELTACRVERFTKSSKVTEKFSFYGDAEVQILSSTDVKSGYFTLAYDTFTHELPTTVLYLVHNTTNNNN